MSKAKEYIQNNKLIMLSDEVRNIIKNQALKAVEIAENEIKELAIKAFKNSCNYFDVDFEKCAHGFCSCDLSCHKGQCFLTKLNEKS